MSRKSTFKRIGLPTDFGVILLTLGLILFISPYMSGFDFGVFAVPEFEQEAKDKLRLFGPIVFGLMVVLFFPIWKDGNNKRASSLKKQTRASQDPIISVPNKKEDFRSSSSIPTPLPFPVDDENEESIIRESRFEARALSESYGNILKYQLFQEGRKLSYREVLNLWEHNQAFVDFYISIFKKCGFDSFVWETPSISTSTVNRTFEFILHNAPRVSNTPDSKTYESYFDIESTQHGIVAFENLGGDALLVVPSPFRKKANYRGLTEFFREAPLVQQRAIWRELALHVNMRLSEQPTWISAAGGGISWLHLRLDSRPKYYRYSPYRSHTTTNSET